MIVHDSKVLVGLVAVLLLAACGAPSARGSSPDLTGRWRVVDVSPLTATDVPELPRTKPEDLFSACFFLKHAIWDFYGDYTLHVYMLKMQGGGGEVYMANTYGGYGVDYTEVTKYREPTTHGEESGYGIWFPLKSQQPGYFGGYCRMITKADLGFLPVPITTEGEPFPLMILLLSGQGDTRTYYIWGTRVTMQRVGPPQGLPFGNDCVNEAGQVENLRELWSHHDPESLHRFEVASGHLLHIPVGPAAGGVTPPASSGSGATSVAPVTESVAPAPAAPSSNGPASAVGGGYLGVSLTDGPYGPFVTGLIAGSPAAQKLLPADTLVMVDQTPIQTVAQATRCIGSHQPGQTVLITVRRNGQLLSGQFVLANHPATP